MTYEVYAKYRDSKKLTDYSIAKALNIHSQSFYQWKQGTTMMFDTQKKIAEYLKIPLKELVG